MRAVIDTNVLRVASGQHNEVSPECVAACVSRLLDIKQSGVTVLDDNHEILSEYLKSPDLLKTNQMGGQFLKWLLQNKNTQTRVELVPLTKLSDHEFAEFPDLALPNFDPPDRKFVAVANAHPNKPPVWQSTDSKWLDWWPALKAKGVRVEFLCSDEVCKFYRKKFPNNLVPILPE